MILYVNGDSHSSGSEAVNSFCFANDDSMYWQPQWLWMPHPDNLAVSYGKKIADYLSAELVCAARAASSNDRVIRTTTEYLKHNHPDLIIIGWSTWEREEWYDEDSDTWYQVNSSGADQIPIKWNQRYKEFVVNIDWHKKLIEQHEKIWQFHNMLKDLQVPHLFFNCFHNFEHIVKHQLPTYDWGLNYINPYSKFSYLDYLVQQGCKHNKWYHFDADAHAKWADFLLPHLTQLL